MIGLEVDVAKTDKLDDTLVFVVFECLCLAVFIMEMLLKFHLLGWDYFSDGRK